MAAAEGKVASRTRADVGGLHVEIVDKNVGNDMPPLAKVLTDDRSYYWPETIINKAILAKTGHAIGATGCRVTKKMNCPIH